MEKTLITILLMSYNYYKILNFLVSNFVFVVFHCFFYDLNCSICDSFYDALSTDLQFAKLFQKLTVLDGFKVDHRKISDIIQIQDNHF